MRENLSNALISRHISLECTTIADVFVLIKVSMEFCEMYSELNGSEKEDLVFICLTHIITEKVIGYNTKVMLLTMIELSIHMVISVSKNEWLINNLKKGNLSKCFCFS